jgi:hypothetical protein
MEPPVRRAQAPPTRAIEKGHREDKSIRGFSMYATLGTQRDEQNARL